MYKKSLITSIILLSTGIPQNVFGVCSCWGPTRASETWWSCTASLDDDSTRTSEKACNRFCADYPAELGESHGNVELSYYLRCKWEFKSAQHIVK